MMVMLISNTLLLRNASRSLSNINNPFSTILTSSHHRHQSSQASKSTPQLPVIENEENDLYLKLLEDNIQRFIVNKATPDWLPFIPGSSFWVPPTPSPSTFFHNITAQRRRHHNPLSLSLRASPQSLNLFIPENESGVGGDSAVEVNDTPEGTEVVTVKVKVQSIPENISVTEDEEG
ncbi:hypothetical protein TanjilG_13452 [Lupinus angustifolius]|uniref:Uncharacterized protein n=1 Tax=Lupinus angustifolius TaxID=3871 RepID=A0A4P1RVL7_LUPAN|nr:PREDICTED: uncharacterized protein LOC109355889 [Lupinus angustifolius]XP_019454712.1 PREDICTED: uncharacterized protein LOC109355889 [Lupinus angustifolius]XP_019454721.1 PREDICTED: uncharacterized protein LOC109355889 [Lupinus angustifolius]OIW18700.1 hypothetical protein TanjilG_13452 [Lupinus angustifolius]